MVYPPEVCGLVVILYLWKGGLIEILRYKTLADTYLVQLSSIILFHHTGVVTTDYHFHKNFNLHDFVVYLLFRKVYVLHH